MPALAAAVTPIMKLLVVVETLNGMRIARSMASTLNAPEPMPSRPDSVPATNIRLNPSGTRCTSYDRWPCGGVGKLELSHNRDLAGPVGPVAPSGGGAGLRGWLAR